MNGIVDAAAFRQLFPVTATRSYLFAGGIAPAATPVISAAEDWLRVWRDDPIWHRAHYFDDWELLRLALARLFGVSADQIAILENTSRASNIAVDLIDSSGPVNVVTDATTYPSSLLPWQLESRSNVEVRRVPNTMTGDMKAYEALVDDGTVAITVSQVDPLTGFRHDLIQLGALAHSYGARLIADVAQSAGVVPVELAPDGADIVTGTLMKWLLGPPGLGYLVLSNSMPDTPPPHIGYRGMAGSSASGSNLLDLLPGARRHELGIAALSVMGAARCGVELVLDASVDAIGAHISMLSGMLIEGLRDRGFKVRTPSNAVIRAGVVAAEYHDAVGLAHSLRAEGVDIWGYPDGWFRVDPHFYNTRGDIELFFNGIDRASYHPTETRQ